MFGSILLSVRGREVVRVPRQKPAVSMTGEYREENERDGRAKNYLRKFVPDNGAFVSRFRKTGVQGQVAFLEFGFRLLPPGEAGLDVFF